VPFAIDPTTTINNSRRRSRYMAVQEPSRSTNQKSRSSPNEARLQPPRSRDTHNSTISSNDQMPVPKSPGSMLSEKSAETDEISLFRRAATPQHQQSDQWYQGRGRENSE
jgi:hypothetical protein